MSNSLANWSLFANRPLAGSPRAITQAPVSVAISITTDGLTVSSTTNLDGAIQVDNTITVGVDDTGYDVKFFGDTASAYMLWDTSTDDLVLAGAAGLDIAGDIDVDGTANLDVVDIDGAVDMASTLTLAGNADFNGDLDVDGTTNLDNTDIDGTLTVDGTNTTITSTIVSLVGAVTASSNISASGNLSATGNLDIDGTSNLASDLYVGGNITGSNDISASGNIYGTGNLDIDGTSNFAGEH